MSDLIDRQAAIEAAVEYLVEYCGGAFDEEMQNGLIEILNVLPSAEPERKRGEWIRTSPTEWMWTCSCCKKDDAYAYSAGESCEHDVLQDLFCPNCGADMRGEENGCKNL